MYVTLQEKKVLAKVLRFKTLSERGTLSYRLQHRTFPANSFKLTEHFGNVTLLSLKFIH